MSRPQTQKLANLTDLEAAGSCSAGVSYWVKKELVWSLYMKLAVVAQMGRTLAGADSLDTTCIELTLSKAKPGGLPSSDFMMVS